MTMLAVKLIFAYVGLVYFVGRGESKGIALEPEMSLSPREIQKRYLGEESSVLLSSGPVPRDNVFFNCDEPCNCNKPICDLVKPNLTRLVIRGELLDMDRPSKFDNLNFMYCVAKKDHYHHIFYQYFDQPNFEKMYPVESCVWLVEDRMTWRDARRHCMENGGDLVKLWWCYDQMREMTLLYKNSETFKNRISIWVGAARKNKDDDDLSPIDEPLIGGNSVSDWAWTDGSLMDGKDFFLENQPSNNMNHDYNCQSLRPDGDGNYIMRMGSTHCSDKNAFFCEVRMAQHGPNEHWFNHDFPGHLGTEDISERWGAHNPEFPPPNPS